MKITFNVDEFLPRLVSATSVINSKNTIAALDNVLCEPKEGSLLITAADGETWVTVKAPLMDCDGEAFPFLVGAKMFVSALRNLSHKTVELDVAKEKQSIRGKYDKGKFEYPFMDAGEFPSKTSIKEKKATITIGGNDLIKAINAVNFASFTDMLRPIFCGVHFDFLHDSLVTVATDTRVLVKKSTPTAGNDSGDFSFTLPTKPSGLIAKLINAETDFVTITYDESTIEITDGDCFTMTARTVGGKYPNYDAVIPKDNAIKVDVDKNDLVAAVNRVLTFGSSTISLIILTLDFDDMIVSAQNLDFATSAEEHIHVKYEGEKTSIGVNGEKLLELLRNQSGERVILHVKDAAHAGIITNAQDEGYIQLFMPMQIS